MVSQLTLGERHLAIVVLILVALAGLAMAVAGRADPMGVHGLIVMVASAGLLFAMLAALFAPEPSPEQFSRYYDDPTKAGIVLSMIWAVVGMAVGVWVAALLAWPDLTFDAAWASFGRLRPVHTSRRHLRLRRQRADRHVLPRPAAHVARPPARPVQPLVRAASATTCFACWPRAAI